MKELKIMPRDLRILADLCTWGVLSMEQIRTRHFKGLSISVSSERTSKLAQAGYLQKRKVGTVIYQRKPKEVGVVLLPTLKAIRLLSQSGYSTEAFSRPRPLNTSQLHHELLLFDLAHLIESKFSEGTGVSIFRGSHLMGALKMGEQVPDLVCKAGDQLTAVELELTAKSSQRYEQIMASYRLDSRFQKVLYVSANEHINHKILKSLGCWDAREKSMPCSFEHFEFHLLAHFFDQNGGLQFFNQFLNHRTLSAQKETSL